MLVELHLENLGLIKDAQIELGPGLNVITGETGAGKTLCVEAVSYLCGARAPRDAIGPWKNSATIEARFILTQKNSGPSPSKNHTSRRSGSESDEGEEIVVRRILDSEARGRQYLNGQMVTVTELEQVLEDVVQIYGQFSAQALAEPRRQLALLDAYAGRAVLDQVEQYAAYYAKAKRVHRLLSEMEDPKNAASQIDLLRHEISEISSADLHPNEDEELESEIARLERAEELRAAAVRGCEFLEGAEDAVWSVVAAGPESGCDTQLDKLRESCRNIAESLRELRRGFRSYFEAVETDERRLLEARERLDLIGHLKRKYGRTIEDILNYATQAQGRLEQLESSEQRAAALRQELDFLSDQLSNLAGSISKKRRDFASSLGEDVRKLLSRLGMEGACFEVEVESAQPRWPQGCGPTGCDNVSFLFSPAKGVPEKPLHRVASGGELARVMLALEVCIGGKEGVPTLVFDEVDQGVGGAAALAVGELLAAVSECRQVICVTHFAQVASFGDVHIAVEKGPDGASAKKLDSGERVREISRMLGGLATSPTANRHAREILQRAASRKVS